MEKHIFLAFDLGATSGRSILGTVADGKVEIKELTRFPNAVTELHGKYYWNLMGLYQALREGLVACSKEGIVPESIGIDTWGVDVVPIAEDGSILSMPRAYRDPYTVGMPEKYFEKISKEVVYDKTFEVGKCTITPGGPINFNGAFDPYDITDVEYVELHIDVTNAEQFMGIEFEFEICSGGACDTLENNYHGKFTGVKDGKNVIKVPIEKFTGISGGGFDKSSINYIRMYSNAGTVSEAFTLYVDKVVFVNPKNMPKPNYESGSTGNEYGVKDILVVSNCEDGAGFQNGSAFLHPGTVNVIECKDTVSKSLGTHTVADDISGEDGASRSHKSKLHKRILLESFSSL